MALDGELVMYVCQSNDKKVTKKIAWGGYSYTKRGVRGDVSYWYCDQRKICGASLIERNGVFTRKETSENSNKNNSEGSCSRVSGKGGWSADGSHETHPPDLERVESEISRRARRLDRKQKIRERRVARAEKKAQKESDSSQIVNLDDDDLHSHLVEQDDIRIESVWGHEGVPSSSSRSNSSCKAENFVLIDTDGGCYDAWALILALSSTLGTRSSTKSIQIVGITTVNGCTKVDNALQNVSRVLQTLGKRIPMYKGMDSALMGTEASTPRPPFFGSDGFGDPADLPPLLHEQKIESDHAVNGIIKLAEKYKGKLTIIALGPLTNLAMAVKLKPEIKNYVKEIYIAGGNSEGIGNMTVSSEFNFYVDPEAAEIVLENFNSCPVFVLPWETCIRFAASTYNFRMNAIGSLNTQEVDLLNKIESTILSKFHDQWIAPGAVIVACFLNHLIMRKTEQYHCTVELHGTHTRGMMVVDKNFVRQNPANVMLITKVDLEEYERMLIMAVGGQDPLVLKRHTAASAEHGTGTDPYIKVNQDYF